MRSAVEGGSICSNNSIRKEDHSSHSSTCVVDTTTKGEDLVGWRGKCKSHGCFIVPMRATEIFPVVVI